MKSPSTQATRAPIQNRVPQSFRSKVAAPPLLLLSAPDEETRTTHPDEAGDESYGLAVRAFQPLLERWGQTATVTRPESRIDYAIAEGRRQNQGPAQLSFLPLHRIYLTAHAPNIAYALSEFPDIPVTGFNSNPRNNWLRIANRLTAILTPSPAMRDAFLRAGVRTPVHLVPVPIDEACFLTPDWQPGQATRIDHPGFAFPQAGTALTGLPDPWAERSINRIKTFPKFCYRLSVEPLLPDAFNEYVRSVVRALFPRPEERPVSYAYQSSRVLELTDIVYTAIVNPFDVNANWQDLLSAFVLGLGDRHDATLVVCLSASRKRMQAAYDRLFKFYRTLGTAHRCRVIFTSAELTAAQRHELIRATTCYVDASQAGCGLALQMFQAAGRPAIAPLQFATSHCHSDETGFVVEAHPEPAWWPGDLEEQLTTTRQRIVWQSLVEQFRSSCLAASGSSSDYRLRAQRAREAVSHCAADQVWPMLADALHAAGLCLPAPSVEADISTYPLAKAV